MKKLLILILIFSASTLFSKGYYLITLKSGTKVKADAVVKYNDYIKVYKFGGYIIYPLKNIKSIKYVKTFNFNNLQSEKIKDNQTKCGLLVKNFKATSYLNDKKGIFNVEVNGEIINNCENTFKNVKLNIEFMDKDRNVIAKKDILFEEILPISTKKFHKIFDDIIADNITYFLYKLEYLKEK